MTTVQTVKGKVFHVVPPLSVILTLEDGNNQQFTIPKDQKFKVDGNMVDAFHLRKGMLVSATKIVEVPETVVAHQRHVNSTMPPPPAPPDADKADSDCLGFAETGARADDNHCGCCSRYRCCGSAGGGTAQGGFGSSFGRFARRVQPGSGRWIGCSPQTPRLSSAPDLRQNAALPTQDCAALRGAAQFLLRYARHPGAPASTRSRVVGLGFPLQAT